MAHVAVHINRSMAEARWMRVLVQTLDPFQPPHFPELDVKETNDGYVFESDVPGIRVGDLDVDVSGHRLTVSGQRRAAHDEVSYRGFSRTVPVPQGADERSVSADLDDGVLTIRFRKTPDAMTLR